LLGGASFSGPLGGLPLGGPFSGLPLGHPFSTIFGPIELLLVLPPHVAFKLPTSPHI